MTHPDKGTEMFVYELADDPSAQGMGVGRSLVTALADVRRVRALCSAGSNGAHELSSAQRIGPLAARFAARVTGGSGPAAEIGSDQVLRGAPPRTRTENLRIKSPLLCH